MTRLWQILLLSALAPSLSARADVPNVVADIAPVHSLVATVMDGVGSPDLLVPAATSPHFMSLRPSQMRSLQNADLVIWIGPEMTPWLEKALSGVDAESQLILIDLPETSLLPYREAALFEHDHGHDDDHGDHDDHDDHGDHDDHAEDHGHDAEHHDEDHHDGDDHGHDHYHEEGGADPHVWLDPENAAAWMAVFADRLSAIDPDHAAQYQANAKRGAAEIAETTKAVADTLGNVQGARFVAFHDAYQYFENRFGLELEGSLRDAVGSEPGPARIASIRDAVKEAGVTCAFSEPQFNPGLVQSLSEDGHLSVAVLDPLGAQLETGPDLYAAVMKEMAAAIATCVE